jgi:hypothetical protein
MANNPGKQTPLTKHRRDDLDEAREAYLLEHTPGLKEHDAAQHRSFLQIEEDALARHPDPTPDDIAAADAAEATLQSRKRTELQLRRSLSSWLYIFPRTPGANARALSSAVSERGTEPTRHR